MAVAQTGGFRDIGFALSLGGHLVNRSIGQTSTELLALGAPANTADLALERIADLAFLEICHVKVAAVGDDGAQLWDGRIRHQRPQSLPVGRQLKRRIGRSLEQALHFINGKAASRFRRQHQVVLVGRKHQLRNAHLHGDLELGLKGSNVRVAIFGCLEGLSNRFGRGDDDLVRASSSNQASFRSNA